MDRIAIVGALGLVGSELLSLLKRSKNRPVEIKLLGREDKFNFKEFDVVFLCTPANVAKVLAPLALSHGAKVIDLSSANRHDTNALLFHPSAMKIEGSPKLFAIPNCIVSIMLSVLFPLHKRFAIKRISVVTYQAASGAGKHGATELMENRPPKIFPHPYQHNLFIHEKFEGEEAKIISETKQLLNSPDLAIHVRSVRVPVLRAHSMALSVTFENDVSPQEAQKLLEKEEGLNFNESPTPKLAEGAHEVFFGPVRYDLSLPNTLDLFVCGDQLLRGAALTAFDCYECITSNGIRR